jgi:hypothetical protein
LIGLSERPRSLWETLLQADLRVLIAAPQVKRAHFAILDNFVAGNSLPVASAKGDRGVIYELQLGTLLN